MPFFAIFALVALAEMATFFWVGARIGLGWALGLALATAIVGAVLVRRAGMSVLQSMRVKWSQGQLPGRELTHGAAILVSGAFLISPGFLTDTLGFLLLVPSIRDHIHGVISKRFTNRMTVYVSGMRQQQAREHGGYPDVIDVDEVD